MAPKCRWAGSFATTFSAGVTWHPQLEIYGKNKVMRRPRLLHPPTVADYVRGLYAAKVPADGKSRLRHPRATMTSATDPLRELSNDVTDVLAYLTKRHLQWKQENRALGSALRGQLPLYANIPSKAIAEDLAMRYMVSSDPYWAALFAHRRMIAAMDAAAGSDYRSAVHEVAGCARWLAMAVSVYHLSPRRRGPSVKRQKQEASGSDLQEKAYRLWLGWRAGKHRNLRFNHQFAAECVRRWPKLNPETVKRWCTEWKKNASAS